MIHSQAIKAGRKFFSLRAFFSEVTRSKGKTPSPRDALQFSKSRLIDFGQLPHGQIPSALQYSRPSSISNLPNGVTIATENWLGNEAAVAVAIKAGSRQESISNSSVAQFVSKVAFMGTKGKTKTDIEVAIDRLGGQLAIKVTREMTYFSIFVNKSKVEEAVALLADCILNPTFEVEQIEAIKPVLHKNASSMDPEKNTYENMHYASFRDHSMGQPSTGNRDNVYSITADQVKQFHANHYVGENIVVSGAGQIDSNQFTGLVTKYFGSVKAKGEGVIQNTEIPLFTPSLIAHRDDELPNTSAGAAFIAPSRNHPDFFAMCYFKRIIGEFRVDKYTGANLNTAKLQYNSFHTDLSNYPDIILHKPFYFAYSDVGLIGNFLFGNEVWNRQLVLLSQNKLSEYAQQIQQAEVFRARNTYWNELLTRDCPVDTAVRNSNQAAYLNRLIPRTEIATRISNMDGNYINNIASKWFWDKETSVVAWGPLHNLLKDAQYGRQFRRATLGEYSTISVKYHY